MTDVDAVRSLARLSRLIERSCPDLSLAHYRVLAAVADGDERASRVAQRLALGKPTVSANVDALCRRGLLLRGDVADDQRAVALRLTPDGERVLAGAEAAMAARLADVLGYTADADGTRAALVGLGAGLDGWLAEHRDGDHRAGR